MDPVVTRWARNSDGHFVIRNKRRVLEFVAVKRSGSKHWAIPGGFLPFENRENPVPAMKQIFNYKCFNNRLDTMGSDLNELVSKLFDDGKEVCANCFFFSRTVSHLGL